ncbi:MAG: arsenate reductase [Agriterribacter sp.]
MTLYGIPNCDVTKKAMDWLKKNKVAYTFHNYKEAGISAEKLNEWSKQAGWEKFFNKRSATWKELPAKEQQSATDQSNAVRIMQQHNSVIKRPIIEHRGKLLIGFDEKQYQQKLT